VIVIGIDPHKRSHTAVAVEQVSGRPLAELTVPATPVGASMLLVWAEALVSGQERRFALEDCRHVSANLERFLLGRGETVVRVPPKLMAGQRRGGRERGKSDSIDALAVARAALREPKLPLATLERAGRELKLLVDHRDDLVGERTRVCNRLRWHLHELELAADLPAGALDRIVWQKRIGGRLARVELTVQVRLAREQLARIREPACVLKRRPCSSSPAAARSRQRKSSPRRAESSASLAMPRSPCTPASPHSTSPAASSVATA
jgi:transposase